MKNLISFVTLLIFVNTITNYMIGIEAKDGLPEPVLDTDGNEVLTGTSHNYFIRPVSFGMGGGVTAAIMEGICVYGVVQTKFDTAMGEPQTFYPVGYKQGDAVYESTDLNIAFWISIGCRPSVWKVGDYDESADRNFVMLGGTVGNPGNETISNWFKIERHVSGYYKIVFCPSVCDFCSVTCSDVGIYVQNNQRHLALSEVPFLVQFQKVRFDHKKY